MDIDLPGYAWDLLPYKEKPLDLYRAPLWHAEYDEDKRSPYAAIQSSLGCNFGCAFCMINIINRNDEEPIGVASNYSKMRFWSPSFMIKQFDILAKMEVRTIRIVDEMFLLNRKYYVPLCELLAQRPYASGLRMWAYSRVDTISNPEFLKLIRSAGIKWLALGIESAERSVRLEISKGKFQDVDIKKVVSQVHDAEIEVMANYIVGLPGENLALMQQTLDFSLELQTSGWNMYAAMALPGSALYKQALEKGYELPESYVGYSFHSYETLPMPTEFLIPSQILDFRDKAFIKYHSDPGFLSRIESKFGKDAVENIRNMLKISLKRRIIEEVDPNLMNTTR
jgi:anaerobic magnesium-protoporphyrin IX monomethyl ester cyclase